MKITNKIWASETTVMTLLAVLIGISTGLGIALFRRALDSLFELTINGIAHDFAIGIILFPTLGGLLVAIWMKLMSREHDTGLGVAGIIEAVTLHAGRINLRGSIARVIGAILTVGLGGSAGPEDPSVQIGATIGSQVGQYLRLAEARVKTLVGCGAAAGIGAAFNAPISGVFFAIEIILGEFSSAAIGLVVLAAVAGAVVIQTLLGNAPAFTVPTYQLHSPLELGLYTILGIAAAAVALAYEKFVDYAEVLFEQWSAPTWSKPVLGGLGVGLLAFLFRSEILGTGYPAIQTALQGGLTSPMLLLTLVGLKLIATPLTIGSGGQGGLFAPSLFLGGMLGVAFGSIAQVFFPGLVAPAPAYGLVGMGAVLAGAVRAPITAILLPFEMTQDYHIILPLMFATVVSTVLARHFESESIYSIKLKRRGIDQHAKKDLNLMREILVEEAMTPVQEMTLVKPTTTVTELATLFQEKSNHGFAVLDERGELCGVVTLADLEHALGVGKNVATVADIYTTNVVTAFPDENLDDALRHFGALDVGRIPVVDRRNPRRLLGVLRRSNIVHAYSHALVDKHQRDHHAERLRLEAATGAELIEVDLSEDDATVGKRLKEIPVPDDCVIVSIRRGSRVVVPRGNTQLLAGDRVIAFTRGDKSTLGKIFREGNHSTSSKTSEEA